MNSDMNKTSAGWQEPGMERDQRIASMLGALEPAGDVLGWDNVKRLVKSAPPARVPWYAAFTFAARPMRLAAAPLMVLLLVGVLWMMPAQSHQVGTMVLTKLPTAWDYGSPEFKELSTYAREDFNTLKVPQGELYIKTGTTSGRPQLAFVLMGADEQQTRDYFAKLKEKFPKVAAFKEDYVDVGTRQYGNLLEQVAGTLAGRPGINKLSDEELKLVALKSMSDAGFDNVDISVTRKDDGTIVIEMDAVMRFAVQGHTQEELESAGFNEQLLGHDLYQELLGQLESH